ncbi:MULTISPECIES: transcription/translation regulatory transformer protein RfaH [Pseudomonas nitroreducens/multiresinivorans group]|uniref:Transcription/translation regulatory transformer protein RfaH n=1 Tax=Pseudomonas multiresinivorans TaxID=95301 RepID=A0A7Z3BQ92_9PSED|nr:transcription/translation regulatory transformer protein RfaH [Pseudomonas multiresinivorans]QJP10949.1 transcription/translation regulatory transformer protein RfaH [Pseudomonas multiresinivorans]
MQSTSEKQWYLVQCKPRQDLRALENLTRQQYECLLPMHQVERIRNGVIQQQAEPLFPGYLFIALDTLQDNWMPIRSTRGVSQIVRFDSHPLAVPSAVIEKIRTRDAAIAPLFETGERVRIGLPGSPGVEAIFEAVDGTERVILLLNLLRRESRVSVPITQVGRLA